MLGGVNIQVVSDWPQVPDGVETVRYKGHPLVYALARALAWVGITLEPDILVTRPRYRDADMIMMQGFPPRVLCSPAQFDALKKATAAQAR